MYEPPQISALLLSFPKLGAWLPMATVKQSTKTSGLTFMAISRFFNGIIQRPCGERRER
jgi:hypothetical protein